MDASGSWRVRRSGIGLEVNIGSRGNGSRNNTANLLMALPNPFPAVE